MLRPAAVLLCAGKGTRMNDNTTHKVCYEIAGTPVVVRLINTLKDAGVDRFVAVVGDRAQTVIDCLSGIDGVTFAYQHEQRGTGDAAKIGLDALKNDGYSGPVLILMGDKIIAPSVIDKLIKGYDEGLYKGVFAVQSREYNESGGRILEKNGKVCGILENTDAYMLLLGELADPTEESLWEKINTFPLNEKKKKLLLSRTLEKKKLYPSVTLAGETFDSREAFEHRYVNTATYLVDMQLALLGLEAASTDNAQGELYLTDAVNYIAANSSVKTVLIENKNDLLTYSTMDELKEIQKYFEKTEGDSSMLTASEWIKKFENFDENTRKQFELIYGNNEELFLNRREALVALLNDYISKNGDEKVVIARAPGRVNLMGRHIEHRGGSINVMSINRETLLCAGKRNDDVVNISNIDPNFKEFSFSISENIGTQQNGDWVGFIESDKIMKMVADSGGDWTNYIKAGVLRLQLQYPEKLLCGMNMVFSGDIPLEAGLSSSSSIVVATMEAAIGLNRLDILVEDFITFCGEGEWFVGSRGGAGDHAAMKCSKKDKITHMDFLPFRIGESVDFPSGYRIIVANSFIQAKKSGGAKDQFNQKVASYEFALMLIRKFFPEYSDKVQYLRDVTPDKLEVPLKKIYEMLLKLPEKVTDSEIRALLPDKTEQIDRLQKNHTVPSYYDVRSVMLYGISECARANICIDMLKNKDYKALGAAMNISHNGDRVRKDGKEYNYYASDDYLKSLISMLESNDPEKIMAASLHKQSGGYACSTPVIDDLIDFTLKQKGVVGAQLSGAGLGGCIIVLIKEEYALDYLEAIDKYYYKPNFLPIGAEIFTPVSGSNIFLS